MEFCVKKKKRSINKIMTTENALMIMVSIIMALILFLWGPLFLFREKFVGWANMDKAYHGNTASSMSQYMMRSA